MPPPQRIASLLASATEMLYGLGLGERVVAVSHECDWPAEVLHQPRVTRSRVDSQAASDAIDEQVKQMLAAGAALYEVDVEQLVRLAPELIVTQAQCDVCAVRYEDVLAIVAHEPALRETQVVALNPQSLEEVWSDIHRIAEAARVPEAAEAYVAGLQARVDRVRSTVVTRSSTPRVALIEWTEPLMLSGNWLPEMVELAGGRHDLTQAGVHSPYVSWNDLRSYDPEVVLIMPCGFDVERTLKEAVSVTQQPGWKDLTAVQTGRVWAVDGNAYFNRSGPRLVDSLEILAHLIHPELFPPPASVPEPERVWQRLQPV